MKTIHQFIVKSLEGKTIDFSDFKGKKILIVNVASKCGYTPQYAQLQELYEAFQDRLVIVGCPCNQFGGQEPGDAATIRNFCTIRYGVTFPLTEKLEVKGKNQHPLYEWLTKKVLNGFADSTIVWNFQKFLLDEQGVLIHVFSHSTDPISQEMIDVIA